MQLNSCGWVGLSVGLLWLSVAGQAWGAEKPSAAPANAADVAAGLIPQLGSDLFAVRESTTNQLMRMGIEIKPVLAAAVDDPDPEIRMRARRVLKSIVDADFQHRLALFAEDVNDTKHYDLPGWTQFRQRVGSDRPARSLFVEMQQAEAELMASLEAGNTAAARTLETRIRVAQMAGQSQIFGQGRISADNSLVLGNVVALLFVGSDKGMSLSEDYALQLGNLVNRSTFQQAITSGPQSEMLKKILGAWIARDASQNLSVQNLYLAIRFNLKEGLDPAIRLLQQPATIPQYKPIALFTIAKFGGKEHLAIVEPFLTGTDICAQIDVNGTRYTTQLRDVALYTSIRLAGQDPKNFGFARMPPNDQVLYQVADLGFRTNDERDASFKKWNDWRAANLSSHDAAKAAPAKS